LPVEVWSQFMRVAHRGKPPTDVPGAIAGIIAGFPSPLGAAVSGAPIPPANVPGGRGREPVRPAEGTIDGWFLDRLFSRR
jgi:penicillin-binding protein 1A